MIKQAHYTNEHLSQTGSYLLRLICCALTGVQPPEKPGTVPWELLFLMADGSKTAGLCVYAIQKLESKPPHELWAPWMTLPDRTVHKNLWFQLEREQILGKLKEAGFSCLPLKGIHLASYYPEPGMRSMKDNDILYSFSGSGQDAVSAFETLDGIMKGLGYHHKLSDEVQDEYFKEPFLAFEMHRMLFGRMDPFYQYYSDPWQFARQDPEDPNLFHFTPEGELVYLLAHGYKHYTGSGESVRLLADVYVLLRHYENSLNLEEVFQELDQLGILSFGRQVIACTRAVFSGDLSPLSQEERSMLRFLLEVSVSDRYDIVLKNRQTSRGAEASSDLKDEARRYLLSRIFPPKEWWEIYYPITRKHKWLYPFCWLHRMVTKLLTNGKEARSELWALLKRS